jgi:hypothetical protein
LTAKEWQKIVQHEDLTVEDLQAILDDGIAQGKNLKICEEHTDTDRKALESVCPVCILNENKYFESNLMRKGDHSMPEAVDRVVAELKIKFDDGRRQGMLEAAEYVGGFSDWDNCASLIREHAAELFPKEKGSP